MASHYFPTAEDASDAFYTAFEMVDAELMSRVWDSKNLSCVHPGGSPLISHESIMTSWETILSAIVPPVIRVEHIQSIVLPDTVINIDAELIGTTHHPEASREVVWVTNIFRKTKRGWRMCLRHASLPGPLADDMQDINRRVEGTQTLQ